MGIMKKPNQTRIPSRISILGPKKIMAQLMAQLIVKPDNRADAVVAAHQAG